MRLVLIDEAGTSRPEAVTAVAAVIVEADKQWQLGLNTILDFRDQIMAPEHRRNFIFHGKEMANGGGPFPREKWTLEQRLSILGRIAFVPRELDMGVCIATTRRSKLPTTDSTTKGMKPEEYDYMSSFLGCMIQVSEWIAKHAPDERVITFSESGGLMQRLISILPSMMRSKELRDRAPELLKPFLPITHSFGPVFFATKQQEPLLQLADAVAYSIKRFAQGSFGGPELLEVVLGVSPDKLKYDARQIHFWMAKGEPLTA